MTIYERKQTFRASLLSHKDIRTHIVLTLTIHDVEACLILRLKRITHLFPAVEAIPGVTRPTSAVKAAQCVCTGCE
jgi:hypothetical protein